MNRIPTLFRKQRGFSMVEVIVALSILSIATIGLTSVVVSNAQFMKLSREIDIALGASRKVIDALRAYEFEYVYACYNGNEVDDPVANVPTDNFAVPGLNVLDDDPDGMCGKIYYPENAYGELDETIGFYLHMLTYFPGYGNTSESSNFDLVVPAKDLDGDGIISNTNIGNKYTLLPVAVAVEWKSPNGPKRVLLYTEITRRKYFKYRNE